MKPALKKQAVIVECLEQLIGIIDNSEGVAVKGWHGHLEIAPWGDWQDVIDQSRQAIEKSKQLTR